MRRARCVRPKNHESFGAQNAPFSGAMKHLLLLFALLAFAPSVIVPNVNAAPAKTALGWPSFKQTNSKKVVPEVKAIQFLLRARGFYKAQKAQPDGIFGAQTAAAVKKFQSNRGLKVDGIVGAATFPPLVQTVKRGSRGDAVRAAQVLLRDFVGHEAQYPYASMKVDGVFGYNTESAVRDYQNEHGVGGSKLIKVNGVVDTLTWALVFHSKLDP